MARNVAVVLTSLFLTLAAAECGLRALMPEGFWHPPYEREWPWLEEDPIRSWRNRPGFEHAAFRIDSRGFRGPEQAHTRPADVRRLVCLGDSGTFGLWLRGPDGLAFDHYPGMLRSLLEDVGAPWEVWNGGVLGYSSSTALRFFESEVVDLEPDVVSLRVGFNDHSLAYPAGRKIQEPRPGWLRDLFYGVRHWRLVQLGIVAHRRSRSLRRDGTTTRWTTPEQFRWDLERFAAVARQRGIRLLLIDYPLRAIARGESPGSPVGARFFLGARTLAELHLLHERYQAIQREVARAEGVELVETAGRFAAARTEPFSDHDLVHPNATGARIIAASLCERLEPTCAGGPGGREPK